jgi:hypothetical protein
MLSREDSSLEDGMKLDAKIGDEVEIEGVHIGDITRKGQIVEIMGLGDTEHYRVSWDDGHETLFYPGIDAHIRHLPRAKHK